MFLRQIETKLVVKREEKERNSFARNVSLVVKLNYLFYFND